MKHEEAHWNFINCKVIGCETMGDFLEIAAMLIGKKHHDTDTERNFGDMYPFSSVPYKRHDWSILGVPQKDPKGDLSVGSMSKTSVNPQVFGAAPKFWESSHRLVIIHWSQPITMAYLNQQIIPMSLVLLIEHIRSDFLFTISAKSSDPNTS